MTKSLFSAAKTALVVNSIMSRIDGFREATQEQRDLYGDGLYASNTSVFRNTNQGSLRRTLEHMGELRDSIDQIEQRFSQLKRKSNITGLPADETEQSRLRKTVRSMIRTITDVAQSKSLSMHPVEIPHRTCLRIPRCPSTSPPTIASLCARSSRPRRPSRRS